MTVTISTCTQSLIPALPPRRMVQEVQTRGLQTLQLKSGPNVRPEYHDPGPRRGYDEQLILTSIASTSLSLFIG